MKKVCILCIFVSLAVAGTLLAQEPGKLSLQVAPGFSMPLFESAENYSFGVGGGVNGSYTPTGLPFLFGTFGIDYTNMATQAHTTLNLISLGAGAGLQYSFFPQLTARLYALGGYYIATHQTDSGGHYFYSPALDLSYALSPSFRLGIGGFYKNYLGNTTSLPVAGAFFGGSYTFGTGGSKSRLEIIDITVEPVFPVFLKYYDTNPLGKLTVQNQEAGTVTDVKVSFFVPTYMDKPKMCAVIPVMEKGKKTEVDLYALFNDKILKITESTKVSGEILIEYSYFDSERKSEQNRSIRFHDRNAITWTDDKRAAAFVTAKDPVVLQYAKNVLSIIRKDEVAAVNKNFRLAMGLLEALALSGIQYAVDPTTPYANLSQDSVSLDYLQFPQQTLSYKAGDCDDLSILTCALLESVGVETAFITVPGHIFMAFSLDMPPIKASRVFSDPEDLIFLEGESWIPLEVTAIQKGFFKAWKAAARQWREHNAAGNAAFYPVHGAWEIYEPVGLPDEGQEAQLPHSNTISVAYQKTLNDFISQEIGVRVQEYNRRLNQRPDPRIWNELGVLYARFGQWDQAMFQFQKALNQQEYVPCLVNLGNIHFLKENLRGALEYYSRAEKKAPDNSKVLVGMVRTLYNLGEYDSAREYFQKLEGKDPALAQRYAYLNSGTEGSARASAATEEEPLWDEEL